MNEAQWLPFMYLIILGLAVMIYAILDGYDLGVGILLPMGKQSELERDTMIASIGPFWDANETWLVLAVGVLLIAFPTAHSIIFKALYLPVALMLAGLILRGVAFDFRAKVLNTHKSTWDWLFKIGSIIASMSQGYMLGMYVMGFEQTVEALIFALLSAAGVAAAYAFIGGAWLVMKTEGSLQQQSAQWTRYSGWLAAGGIGLVSIVHPMINSRIFDKWFSLPEIFLLIPIPLVCYGLFFAADRYLTKMSELQGRICWLPFACACSIFFLCFQALAYSFFPYIVPDQLTIWEAASATESLKFLAYGIVFVVPTILIYTVFSYRVFWGKATQLQYY
ncbi:MAG: cytochrome BD ubiquinol oxidase subunit II [Alteromonadaceae bacterium]|nr:MAG: cytochrome BD ubiquinol oxidase subunit II [Alteromonadaceae bacterium]